jgi:hypothetical protein
MDMNRINSIVTRLLRCTDRTIPPEDIDSIKLGVEQTVKRGFTDDEAFRYARNFEEFNPRLSERVACARMNTIANEVIRRTGMT